MDSPSGTTSESVSVPEPTKDPDYDHVKMEAHTEVTDEEDESAGGEEDQASEDAEETAAEELMTDMKLDDKHDEIKSTDPGSTWQYCIEVYPWNANDMASDTFIKALKIADFSSITLKKVTSAVETLEDNLVARQRKGVLKLYLKDGNCARYVVRTLCRTTSAKNMTMEITKKGSQTSPKETALIDLDTSHYSKIRDRDKAKGPIADRSVKFSNLPGSLTTEFLSVVCPRAFPLVNGNRLTFDRDRKQLQQPLLKLEEMINNFDGTLHVECARRSGCRSFVLAHKSLILQGQKITIKPINESVMVVSHYDHAMPGKWKTEQARPAAAQKPHHQAQTTFQPPVMAKVTPTRPTTAPPPMGRGSKVNLAMSASRGHLQGAFGMSQRGQGKDLSHYGWRSRGMGKAPVPLLRPASGHFARATPGMPVPMTGRQKMNEKLWRSTPQGAAGYPPERGAMPHHRHGSIGDSFKQEIASLQSQLEQNTKDLQAKIARLQQGEAYYEYEEEEGYQDVGPHVEHGYDSRDWHEQDYEYSEEYPFEEYAEEEEEEIHHPHQQYNYEEYNVQTEYDGGGYHQHHQPQAAYIPERPVQAGGYQPHPSSPYPPERLTQTGGYRHPALPIKMPAVRRGPQVPGSHPQIGVKNVGKPRRIPPKPSQTMIPGPRAPEPFW